MCWVESYIPTVKCIHGNSGFLHCIILLCVCFMAYANQDKNIKKVRVKTSLANWHVTHLGAKSVIDSTFESRFFNEPNFDQKPILSAGWNFRCLN